MNGMVLNDVISTKGVGRGSIVFQDKVHSLQSMVKAVEKRILDITSDPWRHFSNLTPITREDISKYEALLRNRRHLLNQLFFLHMTQAEVDRFIEVNDYLDQLSQDMCKRLGSLYRMHLAQPRDEFDDDYYIYCTLNYSVGADESVKSFEDDAFYASDFSNMQEFIGVMMKYYNGDIVRGSINWQPDIHNAQMTDKELGINFNFGKIYRWCPMFWEEPAFKDVLLCSAAYEILDGRYFSIPDFLRMDLWETEVTFTAQNFRHTEGAKLQPQNAEAFAKE